MRIQVEDGLGKSRCGEGSGRSYRLPGPTKRKICALALARPFWCLLLLLLFFFFLLLLLSHAAHPVAGGMEGLCGKDTIKSKDQLRGLTTSQSQVTVTINSHHHHRHSLDAGRIEVLK